MGPDHFWWKQSSGRRRVSLDSNPASSSQVTGHWASQAPRLHLTSAPWSLQVVSWIILPQRQIMKQELLRVTLPEAVHVQESVWPLSSVLSQSCTQSRPHPECQSPQYYCLNGPNFHHRQELKASLGSYLREHQGQWGASVKLTLIKGDHTVSRLDR